MNKYMNDGMDYMEERWHEDHANDMFSRLVGRMFKDIEDMWDMWGNDGVDNEALLIEIKEAEIELDNFEGW